jgi:hypothetical protein
VTRTILIVVGVVGFIVSLWLIIGRADHLVPAGAGPSAPQQFDTTGGQEMRPRWNQGKGQGDDATNK